MKPVWRAVLAVGCFLIYLFALYIPIQIVVGLAWGTFSFLIGRSQDDLVSTTSVVILLALSIPLTFFFAFLLSRKTVRWVDRSMAKEV